MFLSEATVQTIRSPVTKRYLAQVILFPLLFTWVHAQSNASATAPDKVYAPLLDFENSSVLHLPPDGLVAADFEGKIYVKATNLHYNHDPAHLAPGSKQSLQVHSRFDYYHSPKTGLTDAQVMFKKLTGKLAVDGFRLWAKFESTQGAAGKLGFKVGGDGLKTFVTNFTVPPGGGWIDIDAKDLVFTDWSKPNHNQTRMSDLSHAELARYSWIDFTYEHKGENQIFYLDEIQTYTKPPVTSITQ